MGRHAALALTALVLGTAGCPAPMGELLSEDLTRPPAWHGASIVVGKNVVVRIENGSGPTADAWAALWVDVLPPRAELQGARIQVVRRGQVYEGPARVDSWGGRRRYLVRGPDLLDKPRVEFRGPDSTTVWLGPICLPEACETVVVGDRDWPPPE
jgi:hypothetical protein